MDLKIIAIYYICDEVVSILRIQDDPHCKMSTAEIMTVGIVSALFYGANIVIFDSTHRSSPSILNTKY